MCFTMRKKKITILQHSSVFSNSSCELVCLKVYSADLASFNANGAELVSSPLTRRVPSPRISRTVQGSMSWEQTLCIYQITLP